MAVISTEGVVGKVIAVGPSSSRVLLINDHNSALDAFDQRSRARGIVAGVLDDGLTMKYVDRSEDVKPGDSIVTSGMDGIFPRGLLVGQVTRVSQEGPGLFLNVNIPPAADFRQLEHVLIVTQKPPEPAAGRSRVKRFVRLVALFAVSTLVALALQTTASRWLPFGALMPDLVLMLAVDLGLQTSWRACAYDGVCDGLRDRRLFGHAARPQRLRGDANLPGCIRSRESIAPRAGPRLAPYWFFSQC